ncbi:hypothetical protein BRPE64_DCDS11460 (plasmid) [Caballeronia insecticola]|uniref:Uncharacterized protein n=1 Tax=Caballeronia insecticola TaxID=758793 RepID=R4X5C4_9BURK|nr:hypothetical protein BRPE64_DCDS11460 [Caballeronia insecticola]
MHHRTQHDDPVEVAQARRFDFSPWRTSEKTACARVWLLREQSFKNWRSHNNLA